MEIQGVVYGIYLAEREFFIMQVEIRMYSLDVGQRGRERDGDMVIYTTNEKHLIRGIMGNVILMYRAEKSESQCLVIFSVHALFILSR